eukprot:CAMPEP_0175822136 /NCGR_PEP_ID=MMETSP0107_2-20121207/9513_1 /TAXON_ID=195067 ORGANISM="Goniomonas pacifica, Strain CCMP1869" /NCGR_SAMPLE_ID=MMETSP0107_2 /ASSEMBLY_ACC=CAM_ASM_000203 /LENGTH=747 /DNA_ID=CAMNT_0017134573 /DNA_START=541 /DNA_END=2787 /DNA_ORIENTATION=+
MPQTTTAPLPPPTIDTPLHAEATLITGTVAMTGTVWIHVDHAAVGVVHVVAGFNQTGWLTWSYKASPALLRQGDVVFAVLDVFPRVSVPSVSVVVSAVLPDPPTVTGPIYAFASVVHGTFDGVINVGTLVTVYAQGYAIGGADVESRSWSVAIAQNISHLLVVGAAVHATITDPHGNVTSSHSKVVYVEQAPTTTPMPATTTPVAPTTINCEYVDCPNSTHCVVIDPCPGNMACLALPYTTCQPDHTSSAAPTTTTTTAAAPTTVAAGTTPCHGFGCIDVQLPDPGLFTSSAAAATTLAPTETESATTAASVEGSTAVPATTAAPAPTTVGLSLQPYEPNIGVVHFGDYAEMAITLSIDYATVAGSPSLASSFVEVLESDISHASLNKALPVTRRLAPGSVVATVHVFAADGRELKAVAEDIVDQAADPNSLLKQGILTRAITSVVITRYAKVNPPLSPTPTSKPSEGSSPPINRNGIAIIVAAVVVLAAVVSTIVFVTRRRRRAAQRERYVDGAQPANVFTEVGPDGMVRRPSERPLMDVTPVAHRQPSAPLPGDEADLAHMKRLAQAAAVGIAGAAAEGGEDLEYMKARAAAKNQALEEDGEPDFANFEFQRGELRLKGKAAAAEDADFSNFDFSQGEGGQPKGSVRYQVSSNIEAELEDGTVAGLGPRDVDIEMSSLEPTSLTTRPMAGVSVLSDVVALQSHSVGGEQSLQTRTMASLPTASGADSDQEAEVETPPGTPPTGEE